MDLLRGPFSPFFIRFSNIVQKVNNMMDGETLVFLKCNSQRSHTLPYICSAAKCHHDPWCSVRPYHSALLWTNFLGRLKNPSRFNIRRESWAWKKHRFACRVVGKCMRSHWTLKADRDTQTSWIIFSERGDVGSSLTNSILSPSMLVYVHVCQPSCGLDKFHWHCVFSWWSVSVPVCERCVFLIDLWL